MPSEPAARAALLLAALVLLPAAAAQEAHPVLSVEPLDGPLPPGTERDLDVTVRVPCAGTEEETALARFALDEAPPAWLDATLSPAEARAPAGPCVDAFLLRATLRVRATEEAPALRTHVLRIAARVDLPEGGSRSLSADAPVQVGALVRIAARGAPAELAGAPGSILTFPIELVNLGNDRARVMVSVLDNPDNLNVVIPPPVMVESPLAGGSANATLVRVQVQMPSDAKGVSTLRMGFHPSHPIDPRLRGEPQEVTLRVEAPAQNLTPGPGLHGALLVLGAGALALRRSLPGTRR